MSEENENENRKPRLSEMEALMEGIGKPIRKAVTKLGTQMAKQSALRLWNDFKRMIATASEPFFRKEMGERYFGAENLIGGFGVWVIGTMLSTFLYVFCFVFGAVFLQNTELLVIWIPGSICTGGAMALFFFILGTESINRIAQFRAQGVAYHTRSRGTLRWGDYTIPIMIGMVLVLFLFNIVSCVFFIMSRMMSAKLAAEQDAAIYSRYLDALDARIEQEYLKSAILGKCPVEITQLSRPLPNTMTNELRENIAAAAVGEEVTIIAKGTSRAATPMDGGTRPPKLESAPAGIADTSGSHRPGIFTNPRPGAPSPVLLEPAEILTPRTEKVQQQAQSYSARRPASSAVSPPVEPEQISKPEIPIPKADLNLPLFNPAPPAATIQEQEPQRVEPEPITSYLAYFELQQKLEKSENLPDIWTKRLLQILNVLMAASNDLLKLGKHPQAVKFLRDFQPPFKSLLETALDIDAKAAMAKETHSQMDEESSQRASALEGEIILLQNAMKARIGDLKQLGVSMN